MSNYKTLLLDGPATTTTSTTTFAPQIYPHVNIPNNSGILDFTITNPYIHYVQPQQNASNTIISFNPSGCLVLAPILFNYYNVQNRRGTFVPSTTMPPTQQR